MSATRKKKVNPRRKPTRLTEADVKKIQDEAVGMSIRNAFLLVLYVLADKHDAPQEELQQLFQELHYAADSVNKKYITWADKEKMLLEEYEIELDL